MISELTVYVISLISFVCFFVVIYSNQIQNSDIADCIFILFISAAFAIVPTLIYSNHLDQKTDLPSQCMTVKVTKQIEQEINRPSKLGGKYTRYIYYIENAPIPYFSVGANQPIPTIKDGMTTIKLNPYITNKDKTIQYSVDTSSLSCN